MSEAIGQPGQAALPRPLGIGEILSTAFQLYRRHWRTLLTIAAVVVAPAAIVLLGDRLDAFDVRRLLRRILGRPEPTPKPVEETFWYRSTKFVMRRAIPIGLAIVAARKRHGNQFIRFISITRIAAGPRMTMKSTGRKNRIIGTVSLGGSAAAFFSASDMRMSRFSCAITRKV